MALLKHTNQNQKTLFEISSFGVNLLIDTIIKGTSYPHFICLYAAGKCYHVAYLHFGNFKWVLTECRILKY